MSRSSQEALPELREESRGPPKSPGWVKRTSNFQVWDTLPKVRKGLRGPPRNPGEVGKLFRRSVRPFRRSKMPSGGPGVVRRSSRRTG